MNTKQVLLDHLRSSPIGRIRLKLYQEIAGSPGIIPTNKQAVAYMLKIARKKYEMGALITHLLTSGSHSLIKQQDQIEPVGIEELFAGLNQFPPSKPWLYVVEKAWDEEDIAVWVQPAELKNGLGYFFTMILFEEESFPGSLLGYLEIRVSQSKPEPAVVIMGEGEPTIVSKNELMASDDPRLQLCMEVLQFMAFNHAGHFIPVDRMLEKKYVTKSRAPAPEDENIDRLIKEVADGKAVCSVARIGFERIIPFSYDHCFEMPVHLIKQAEEMAEQMDESGMMIYWNGTYFVMSDDYLSYLSLRKAGYLTAKCIIMGAVPADIEIIQTGGLELLPPVLTMRILPHDLLPVPLKDAALEKYLRELNTGERLKNIAAARCIVFTEDKNVSLLETLLIASGFDIDQTIIYSYKNCTRLDALELNIQSIRKINPQAVILVHRDKDYLTDEEITREERIITEAGGSPFITIGNCIESYFLDVAHIRNLYSQLETGEIEEILQQVFWDTEQEALSNLEKKKLRNKNRDSEQMNSYDTLSMYSSDRLRYTHGKSAFGLLVSKLQLRLKENPKLVRPTPTLTDPRLIIIAENLW